MTLTDIIRKAPRRLGLRVIYRNGYIMQSRMASSLRWANNGGINESWYTE